MRHSYLLTSLYMLINKLSINIQQDPQNVAAGEQNGSGSSLDPILVCLRCTLKKCLVTQD